MSVLIYFIISISWWVQTDWSGSPGESLWADTSSYLASEGVDGKLIPGELELFAPSGEWQSSVLLEPLGKIWVNAIEEGEGGMVYAGCGWDSARVFELGDFGATLLSIRTLSAGQVLSLLRLHNGNILAGTNNGDLFIWDGTTWDLVKNFGQVEIRSLYQPPSFFYVYLGTSNSKIWIDYTGSGWQWNTFRVLTGEVMDIFYASNKNLYACTKSDTGRLFWSDDDGDSWYFLHSFPGALSVYSICEAPDGKLYVSTGNQGKIFMSSDSGQNWQEVSSPWSPAKFYHIISDNFGILYVGGKATTKVPKGMIFRSEDKGQTWDTLFYSDGWCPSQIFSMRKSHLGPMFAGGDTNVIFISGYRSSGWLESSIYDVFGGDSIINESLEFINLHFNVETPAGCTVLVKVRSCKIPELDSMPSWDNCDFIPNDGNPVNYGCANDGDRYIQYKVELVSESLFSTPVMQEILVKYKIDVEPPIIDSAIAYDGEYQDTLIDEDDYVVIWFNEPTTMPWIETSNVDQVLRLSNGHSWRSDTGRGVIKYPGEWVTPSALKICLTTLRVGNGFGYFPTIEVGDTIYPDTMTIQDKWGNPSFSWCVITGAFGVEEKSNIKNQISKIEISPNPFIRVTSIKYQIATKSKVSLRIYDVAGRLLKTLVNEEKPAGLYSIELQKVSSEICFVSLKVGEQIFTQKLINFNK